MARFSSIIMPAAVPIMGSWKTRPMYLARLCSGHFVMSVPAMTMLPASTRKVPAMEFISVDLPAPLPPMTVTKSPGERCSVTPRSAYFSVIVPGLKVLAMF